jgi:GNAT superfamily N-acetyltransferase
MIHEQCKTFIEKFESSTGCAELSLIIDTENWYYFNRLFVNRKIRGNGIAKKLLEKVAIWADETKVNIFLSINPYGDLTLEQLIELYSRYGFTSKYFIDETVMVRLSNNGNEELDEEWFNNFFRL